MEFSHYNLTTAILSGCEIAPQETTKLIAYMKDAWKLLESLHANTLHGSLQWQKNHFL